MATSFKKHCNKHIRLLFYEKIALIWRIVQAPPHRTLMEIFTLTLKKVLSPQKRIEKLSLNVYKSIQCLDDQNKRANFGVCCIFKKIELKATYRYIVQWVFFYLKINVFFRIVHFGYIFKFLGSFCIFEWKMYIVWSFFWTIF